MNFQQMASHTGCDSALARAQLSQGESNDSLEQASTLLFDMIREEVTPTAGHPLAGEAEYASWLAALREAAVASKERA